MNRVRQTNQPNKAPSAYASGFTMVEILVVIGIIAIVAALAVPAINVLSGSRSIDGASNVVASMLAAAREQALSRQSPVGVAIFEDANQQRVGLALVSPPQPWSDGVAYVRGDPVTFAPGGNLNYYICTVSHTSSATATGGDSARPGTGTGWAVLSSSPPVARRYQPSEYVSLIPEADVTYLPPGVGAQVLNSARGRVGAGAAQRLDRYLAASVIFFDADGKMGVNRRFGVLFDPTDLTTISTTAINSSRLGLMIQFDKGGASSSTNMDPVLSGQSDDLTSGLGVVLFDRQAFKSQQPPPVDGQLMRNTGYRTIDQENEAWLDANGTVLLVNRYNGSVLKTE